MDLILVNGLALHARVGDALWPKPSPKPPLQPVLISISVPYSLRLAGNSDNLSQSLNYGTLCEVTETCVNTKGMFNSLEHMAEQIARVELKTFASVGMTEITLKVEKPRGLLHAKSIGLEITRYASRDGVGSGDVMSVRGLELSAIVGIHPWERVEKQLVTLDLSWTLSRTNPQSDSAGFAYRSLVQAVSDHVEGSSYKTLEALASSVAENVLSAGRPMTKLTVCVGKPSALTFASSAEISITRTAEDFAALPAQMSSLTSRAEYEHIAAVALGSNLGDRVGNIEAALHIVNEIEGSRVLSTSFLYETQAMYFSDQPRFINGACLIGTNLSPTDLLAALKRAEVSVGRTPTFQNGPRIVDLDIILYDDVVLRIPPAESSSDEPTHQGLIIPHPRMQEREFVLRPLADIIPDLTHPTLNAAISSLLEHVQQASSSEQMFKILAFPTPFVAQSEGSVVWPLGKRTYIMATLNCTPDSFSDGGDHHTLSTALEFARSAVANGADMIDIGGYSTRPGAEDISPEEEMNRVIPAIKAIRNAGISLPISIDTFRAAVAEKAIQAGANCINDVKALDGEDDERMRELASRLGVPVIFVHSRGDAGSNKSYPQPGVAAGVRTELGEKIAKALKAGVKRWNVVGDPGIGFSKTPEDNATLLRDLARFTAPEVVASSRRSTVRDLRLIQPVHPLTSLPVLVGTSRKSFLSTLVGRPTSPKERGYATAATCVVAVQQGCDIVRVHDVLEMRDAVRVADTVWRSR